MSTLETALKIIRNRPLDYVFIAEELKSHPEIVNCVLSNRITMYFLLPIEIQKNIKYATMFVESKYCCDFFNEMPEEIRTNADIKKLLLKSLNRHEFGSNSGKDSIILKNFHECFDIKSILQKSPLTFEELPEEYKHDQELLQIYLDKRLKSTGFANSNIPEIIEQIKSKYEKVVPVLKPPKNYYEALYVNGAELSDIHVGYGDRRLNFHRLVLKACCLSENFSFDCDIPENVVENTIKFLYQGGIVDKTLTVQQNIEIFYAIAEKYILDEQYACNNDLWCYLNDVIFVDKTYTPTSLKESLKLAKTFSKCNTTELLESSKIPSIEIIESLKNDTFSKLSKPVQEILLKKLN